MSFSSVLVSLALLFCISSVSAQNLIVGTWHNSFISKNVSSSCCVPSLIKVTCPLSDICYASYSFPSSLNSTCWNLFNSSTNGLLRLHPQGSDHYFSEPTIASSMRFNFMASNNRLKIFSTSSEPSDECDFTMLSRNAPYNPPSGGNGHLIGLIIIVVIIVACCGGKKYKKNQAHVILAENLDQQPAIVAAPGVYVAPSNQEYVQQPQMAYAAPNQFPNIQVSN